MATCYICGQVIRGVTVRRRRVQTGSLVRRKYGWGKVELAQTTYGARTLCSRCARHLDRRELRMQLLNHLPAVVALIVLLVVLLFAK